MFDRVESCLSFGKIAHKPQMAVLYTFISILGVSISIVPFLFAIEIKYNGAENVLLISTVGVIISLLLSLYVYLLVRNIKDNNNIKTWLEDAVMLHATISKVGLYDRRYQPYQIAVTFEYNHKKQVKISLKGDKFFAYGNYFSRYKNGAIKIYYSPRYDEVMIIKSN